MDARRQAISNASLSVPHLHSCWGIPRTVEPVPTRPRAVEGIPANAGAQAPTGPHPRVTCTEIIRWNQSRALSKQGAPVERSAHLSTAATLTQLAQLARQLYLRPSLDALPPPVSMLTDWHLARSTGDNAAAAWHWQTFLQFQKLLAEIGQLQKEIFKNNS